MAAQICQKKCIFKSIFKCLLAQNLTNQTISSRPCGRLLENSKQSGSGELFLPKNYFKT